MKKTKFVYVFLVFLFSIGMFGKVNADTVKEIKIDELNFPDSIFRNFAIDYDTDKNGYLSNDELIKISDIYFDGGDNKIYENIVSLKGIEYFSNLKSVYLNETKITNLDLSKNVKLTKVSVLNPKTEELILPKESGITELRISNYMPSKLDVGRLKELKKIQLTDCTNILVLDLTQNQKIKSIDVSRNIGSKDNLRQLRLGTKTQLKFLALNRLTKFKKLSNGKTPALDGVYITKCKKLKKLNVGKMPKLRKLNIAGCGLKTLDLRKNKKLKTLICNNNKITKLNISKNKMLKTLDCKNNKIKELNLYNRKIKKIRCDKNVLIVR